MAVRTCTRTFAISVALLVLPGAATAQPQITRPIVGLFNTGVNGASMPLPDDDPDGTMDPHYELIQSPGSSVPVPAWVVNSMNPNTDLFPPGPWLPNATAPMADSNWISPRFDASTSRGSSAGNYVYQTTFDLRESGANCDPTTARITGRWITDNDGLDIEINENSTGQFSPGSTTADFSIPTPFVISGGFVAGVNTVDFFVNNAGGPTGLRVEMSGTVLCDAPAHVSNWVPNVGIIGTVLPGPPGLEEPPEQPLGDLWTFVCPIGGRVTASVDTKDDLDSEESCLDPVLDLRDGAGNQLAFGDDEVPCTYSSVCGYRCPSITDVPCGEAVIHSLIVRDFGIASTTGDLCNKGGGYELRLQVFDRNGQLVDPRIGIGSPSRQVPIWAIEEGKARLGPVLDDENVPFLVEDLTK